MLAIYAYIGKTTPESVALNEKIGILRENFIILAWLKMQVNIKPPISYKRIGGK